MRAMSEIHRNSSFTDDAIEKRVDKDCSFHKYKHHE